MTAPVCPADGCTRSQAVRRDGVPLGWCTEHRSERLRTAPVGTVKPGPRGRGHRVKTATGWVPSDEQGRPLRGQRTDLAAVIARTEGMLAPLQLLTAPGLTITVPSAPATAKRSRAARPDRLTAQQAMVLDALLLPGFARTDHAIAFSLGLHAPSVGKRLAELVEGGLARVVGKVGRRRLYEITEQGTAVAMRAAS